MNEIPISKLREIFLGEYSLERVILKHGCADNSRISMTGKVTFTPISKLEIEYRESGNYILNNISYDFYQVRYFRFSNENLFILKSDKTNLHTLPLRELLTGQQVSHSYLCNDDIYLVTMKLEFGSINIDYEVSGPVKNYTTRTVISPGS